MTPDGRRRERKRLEAFMNAAKKARTEFCDRRAETLRVCVRDRSLLLRVHSSHRRCVQAETTRQAMESEEADTRKLIEDTLRQREDREVLFQVSMRDEWLRIVTECVGKVRRAYLQSCVTLAHVNGCPRYAFVRQERMGLLSWRRGIKRGTFSSFHLVRDVNAGELFVIKSVFLRSETMEKRMLLAAEFLQARRGAQSKVSHRAPSVPSCTVVYCRVLSCTVVYCRVLSCTVVYCRVLSCTVVYCGMVSCGMVLYCML
jgi:hypothetical protein